MGGSYTCPYCKTENACNCPSCKPHIKENEYVNTWTEDGNCLICAKCNKTYSPDQSLEEEFKQTFKHQEMQKYNVVDSIWFEKMGIVKVKTKFSGHKFYIGKGLGFNEKEDEQSIARNGMPVPIKTIQRFFKTENDD